MGTNTLQTRSAGETITADFFNDFNTALQTTVVGRNASGAATSGQNLGSSTVPWGAGYFNSIVLNGDALDASQITAPANRITSGATRSSSNQPHFITANGSATSCIINGNTTNLIIDVNGAAVTCSTDITISSLTVAPSSNNTCLVNEPNAADAEATRYWGEPHSPFHPWNSPIATDALDEMFHKDFITVDTMGSEISGLVGKYAAFKINDGSNDEYFIAYVESATKLSKIQRGCFLGNTGLPINRVKFTNNDTITLMRLSWIFLQNDGTTADVSYTNPIISFDQPSGPATGDYWLDLSVNQWKRYSGSAFVTINRTWIGNVIQDTTNCVASRSRDFYYSYKTDNNVMLYRSSATNVKINNEHASIYVYSGKLDFGIYTPDFNITTDLASTATNDAYASESASTYYYLYFKDTGDRVISDIGPIERSDLNGAYHPNNPWRCIGVVFNDSSSDLVGDVCPLSNQINLNNLANTMAVPIQKKVWFFNTTSSNHSSTSWNATYLTGILYPKFNNSVITFEARNLWVYLTDHTEDTSQHRLYVSIDGGTYADIGSSIADTLKAYSSPSGDDEGNYTLLTYIYTVVAGNVGKKHQFKVYHRTTGGSNVLTGNDQGHSWVEITEHSNTQYLAG